MSGHLGCHVLGRDVAGSGGQTAVMLLETLQCTPEQRTGPKPQWCHS